MLAHNSPCKSNPLFFFPFVTVSILTVETDLCLALLCYLAGRCSPPRVWMVTFKSHTKTQVIVRMHTIPYKELGRTKKL